MSLGKESPYIFATFNHVNTDTFYGPLSVHWVWPEAYNPEWGYLLLVWHHMWELQSFSISVLLSQKSFASHLWLHSSPEPTMSHYENLSKKMTSGPNCSNVGEPYTLDKSLSRARHIIHWIQIYPLETLSTFWTTGTWDPLVANSTNLNLIIKLTTFKFFISFPITGDFSARELCLVFLKPCHNFR